MSFQSFYFEEIKTTIGKLFIFVIGGLVAIIVGSFMIRGTMHMWDNVDKDKNDIGNKKTKK